MSLCTLTSRPSATARRLLLRFALATTAVALAVPAMPDIAWAGRRKAKAKDKKKNGKGDLADIPREIKKEEALAPKKDVKLDEDIGKTKDLKPAVTEGNRPTLTPEEEQRAKLENAIEDALDREIRDSEQALEYSAACDDASPLRFRLADLYWEKSKRAFFKSQDFNTPEAERERWAGMMKRYQGTAIAHYEKIVDDCPQFKEYPKVLYYLGKALMEVERAKDGATYFKRVIKEFPDSEWVGHAWFMIGEYYFNVANDANAALKAYTQATNYPKSGMYAYAIYKRGWCFINVGEWQQAMDEFRRVITAVDDPAADMEAKERKSLRREALKDYVRSYAVIGDAKAALKDFYVLGGKDALQWMLEQLGNWYINRDDHASVVGVNRDLIKTFPRSTRLPVYQGRIVDATSRMGDKKQTVLEAKKLTEYFEALRQRIIKKDLSEEEAKTVDKDVKEAEEIAENTLRRLALEYYKEANKLRGAAALKTYEFSEELFSHYLVVFPEPKKDAEVNYVFFMRFYYAEVLYKLADLGDKDTSTKRFLDAARNYDIVVDMDPHPKDEKKKQLVLVAAENSVRAFDEVVQDMDRKSPPKLEGSEPKEIPAIKLDLIRACKRYIDYVGSEGDKIVEIRFKMARIYFTYNHWEEAAPAFQDIVTNHPTSSVACYAAGFVLHIWDFKKNYKNLRDAAKTFLDSKDLVCEQSEKDKFAKVLEESSFLLIKSEYEDKKKYIAAGNAYMQFYKDFPKSQYADDAVYNAAVNFDLGNRLDQANQVREFLVKNLPDSPLVPDTLYNIAQSYERVVDFQNAAVYLEDFANRFPNDKRTKDALYNAALYRATLRDYAGGKAGREKFLVKYPGDADNYQVAFAICESLEDEAQSLEDQAKAAKSNRADFDRRAMDKWEAAHNCYLNYIRNSAYARASADLVCQAQYRRGEIMRLKTNYEKGYLEQKKYLLTNWKDWKKNGVDKVPRCATAIAEIMFKDLEWQIATYRKLTIAELNPTDAGKKKFDASVKTKTTERDKLVAEYTKIVEIGVPEWALASLYDIGELYRDSIQKFVEAPVPDKIPGYKLTNEDKQLLRQQLKEMSAPIEEQALEAYRLCVQKASELGVYNRWTVKALEQLNKLRPQEYPLVTERILTLEYVEKLKVPGNGFVIPEGDTFKEVDVTFKEAGAEGEGKKPAAPAAQRKPGEGGAAKPKPQAANNPERAGAGGTR